jgi:hypothetical protein
MLEVLPSQYYVIVEDSAQDAEAHLANLGWKDLDHLVNGRKEVRSSSPSDSDTDSSEYESEDEEDNLGSQPVSSASQYLCHPSTTKSKDGEIPQTAPRLHSDRTKLHLARLFSMTSATQAFPLFQKLLLLPGNRLCSSCLALPTFLLDRPPLSSPFKSLIYLEWNLSFAFSHDEDLLILLGTDVVGNLKELKLRGRLGKMSREVDLLIRASVARYVSLFFLS